MTRILTALFFLWQFLCHAQIPSANVETEYYRNGKLKSLYLKKGKDTVEIKKFYKSGRLRDSLWIYLTDKDEIPFGTSKSYHENGQLALITHYIKGNEQYVSYEYTDKGRLKRFEQRPTGLTKMYNRKGEQIVEYDYHKLKDVYIPARYRKGKHLQNTSIGQRITTREAVLSSSVEKKEMGAGALITVELKSDTIKHTHWQVEGFSQDSIFLSAFHYNEEYEKGSKSDILKFDSSFVLPVKDLKHILYARHKTKKRLNAALFCTIAGAELILLPIIPLVVLPFVGVEVVSVLKLYAAFAIPGAGIFLLGKYFLKTAVPKPYDLARYSLIIKG